MGYPMIDKFRRAIKFGKPIQSWYRAPLTWDDDNWRIIVRPPSRHCIAIQEIDFHGDDQTPVHLILAFQQGGSFYEFDHVQCCYEHGKRIYEQTFILPSNAEFVARRESGGPAIFFSARGYFIRPAGPGATRIDTAYGSYAYSP
jgi:hypothetical protein